MFRKRPRHTGGPREEQHGNFVKNAMTASTMVSIALMVLVAPDFYHHTRDWVWSFLSARYPAQLLPIAFFAIYAAAYPAMFFLARASWTTSSGMAILWIADKVI